MTDAPTPNTPATAAPPTGADAGDLEELPAEPTPQVAQVHVVVPLTADETSRLQAYLEDLTGAPLELEVSLDPSILGGVWVRIEDLVIDGSVRAKLDALHERLCANCRIPEGAGPATNRNQQ